MDLELIEQAAESKPFDMYQIMDSKISKLFPSDSDILNMMFTPYLSVVKKKQVVMMCPLDKFKRRFHITSDLLEPMEELWKQGYEFVVAGGKMVDFCSNKTLQESTNDYDIFCVREEDQANQYILLEAEEYIQSVILGYLVEWTSKPGSKYHPIKLQTINTLYANPENVIETFDIRACAIACDGKHVFWMKGALKDIKKKEIIMLEPKVSTSVLNRVIKYIHKGYTISVPDLVIASINFLDAASKHHDKQLLFEREYATDRNSQVDYN